MKFIQQVGYDEGVLEEALVVYTKEEEKKKTHTELTRNI